MGKMRLFDAVVAGVARCRDSGFRLNVRALRGKFVQFRKLWIFKRPTFVSQCGACTLGEFGVRHPSAFA